MRNSARSSAPDPSRARGEATRRAHNPNSAGAVPAPATIKRAKVDWEAIEPDYRAGLLSLRELESAHGVSHVAIKKHADKFGWTRDLNARIKAKADALVNSAVVTGSVNSEQVVTDSQVVEAGAMRLATVKQEHRTNIERTRNLVIRMLGELESQTDLPEVFEDIAKLVSGSEGEVSQEARRKLNEAYHKALSLPSRVGSVKALCEALKTMIGLERQAYSLDAVDAGEGGEETLADALRTFVRSLHSSKAGRIQFAPPIQLVHEVAG